MLGLLEETYGPQQASTWACHRDCIQIAFSIPWSAVLSGGALEVYVIGQGVARKGMSVGVWDGEEGAGNELCSCRNFCQKYV